MRTVRGGPCGRLASWRRNKSQRKPSSTPSSMTWRDSTGGEGEGGREQRREERAWRTEAVVQELKKRRKGVVEEW